jgi:hypothetical protein
MDFQACWSLQVRNVILQFCMFLVLIATFPNAQAQQERGRLRYNREPLTLEVYNRSQKHLIGSCLIPSSNSEYTSYPLIEAHLPSQNSLDLVLQGKFVVGSVRFSGPGIRSGVDNVPPFRLLDAVPSAGKVSKYVTVMVEFYTRDNADGRLLRRMKIYLNRFCMRTRG